MFWFSLGRERSSARNLDSDCLGQASGQALVHTNKNIVGARPALPPTPWDSLVKLAPPPGPLFPYLRIPVRLFSPLMPLAGLEDSGLWPTRTEGGNGRNRRGLPLHPWAGWPGTELGQADNR